MPVTKCEPETTRKASRKYAKTQETVIIKESRPFILDYLHKQGWATR